MKLRIQGNSLRLRLTQLEVQGLRRREPVREVVQMGSMSPIFAYSLRVHTDNRPVTVMYQEHEISVSIPEQIAEQWVTTDQVGIEGYIALEGEGSLHVLIEKDFRCLHRDIKEEPDQFPNPQATS